RFGIARQQTNSLIARSRLLLVSQAEQGMTTSIAASGGRSPSHAGGMPAPDHPWPFLDESTAVLAREAAFPAHEVAFLDPLERTVALDGSSTHSTQEISR